MGLISLKHSIFISLLKIFSNVFWQSSKLNYPHRSKTVPSLLDWWNLLDFIYFLIYKKTLIKVVENVSIQNYLFCRSKDRRNQNSFPCTVAEIIWEESYMRTNWTFCFEVALRIRALPLGDISTLVSETKYGRNQQQLLHLHLRLL